MAEQARTHEPAAARPPSHGRRLRRWGVLVLVLLALLIAPVACATRITPPAAPAQPQTVFLLDHGYTASLVLPEPDGRAVRYAYGDWNYYALSNRGWLDGAAALLWPTQATLGRKRLPGPPTAANIRQQVQVSIDEVHPIDVERQRVSRLRGRLERLYQQRQASRVWNAGNDLDFVHHPDDYTLVRNSNRVVADWLRELDCAVRGPTLLSRWNIERP